jgi:hypothetical protein
MKAEQNFVGGVLKTSIWLVQLASRLRGQLAQLITVRYMGKSPKNQIGSHKLSPYLRPIPPTVVWQQQAWFSGQIAPGWISVALDRPVSYLPD